MPRRKAAQHVKISFWMSARPDCQEGRFLQLGNSLTLSKKFQSLSPSVRWFYICLSMEAGGKPTVKLSHGGARKYGISHAGYDRAVTALCEAGFLEQVFDADLSRFKTNEFRFISKWKTDCLTQNEVSPN